MNIIIVGCGKVGYSIAKHLSEEGNNIVIIDKKADVFDKIVESIDAMVIRGNGLVRETLYEASVKTADLIICVTNSDETNILCCVTAKKLGVKNAIARVRDPEYAVELHSLRKDLGLDMIINPEQLAAMEISRLLRFPTASDIDTFVGGRVELVSFRLRDDNDLIGKTISEVFSKSKIPVLMAAIRRGDEAIIPHGSIVLQHDDLIGILGRPASISEFFRQIGVRTAKVKDTMIIGGGKVTFYLADVISRHNIKVKIIEIDAEKCDQLSEALPNCLIIQGDGTDEEVLTSENIAEASSVVCLTDRDEENVVVGMYAIQCGVPKTIVKINHINLNLVKNLGLGSVVCPKNSTAYQILRYVRGLKNSAGSSDIQTLYKIMDFENESIEALEFDVKATSRCLEIPLKDLRIKKGVLIGCIVRNGSIIIPTGTSVIKSGDSVIVIAKNANIYELDNILSNDFAMFGGE